MGHLTLSFSEIEYICNSYLNGKSITKLHEELNIGCEYISKTLKENNVKIRNDKQQAQKYYCDESFFEVIDTEEKAYWLGFIYADGYITEKVKYSSEKIGITLAKKDDNHLKKFKKALKYTGDIKYYKAKTSYGFVESCRILITSSKLVEDLIKLGVEKQKSLILKFPNENQVPKNLLPHFIRGYFDGDGSFNYSKGKWRLDFCGTKEMLFGIQKFFGSNLKLAKRWKDEKNNYSIRYCGNRQVYEKANILFKNATIYLDRKYDRYINLVKDREDFLKNSPT